MAEGHPRQKARHDPGLRPGDGRVTPVTVIEAGPCPVVQVKTDETDGYEAVQLAFDAGRRAEAHEGRARPPEEGRRRRRTGTSSSSAARARRSSARPSPSRSSSPATRSRSPGISIGKGFAGHDQAPQLQPRPEDARLAQHPQARLDRRVGDALARLQGHADGRRMGGKRVTQVGLDGPRGRPRANLLLVKGAVPGPKNGIVEIREEKAMASPKAPLLDVSRQGREGGRRSTTASSAPRSSRTSSTRPCAPR